MEIFLDIETIPGQSSWIRDYVVSTVTHPGQMKKPETIKAWEENEKPAAVEEAISKCSFDGAMNQIICIGVAMNDDKPAVYCGPEVGILSSLWSHVGGIKPALNVRLVGHNVAAFDLRVVRQRSVVLGIKPPSWIPFDAKPWEYNLVYDTMIQWDAKNFTKLDKLAKAFGIEGKSMDGSKVYQMWKEGKHQEIADYCAKDVEMVRAVYKRMTYGY